MFIRKRRWSLKSLPALTSWGLQISGGKGHRDAASCPSTGEVHTQPSLEVGSVLRDHLISFLLTHFTGVETEAWVSMLPNDELSSPLPLPFSPPHPKVKGGYNHSKTQSPVTKEVSTSGWQQKTRGPVLGSSTSPWQLGHGSWLQEQTLGAADGGFGNWGPWPPDPWLSGSVRPHL